MPQYTTTILATSRPALSTNSAIPQSTRPVGNPIHFGYRPIGNTAGTSQTVNISFTGIIPNNGYIDINGSRVYFRTIPNAGEVPIGIGTANAGNTAYSIFASNNAISSIANLVNNATGVNNFSIILYGIITGRNDLVASSNFAAVVTTLAVGGNFAGGKKDYGIYLDVFVNEQSQVNYFNGWPANNLPQLNQFTTRVIRLKKFYNGQDVLFDLAGTLLPYLTPAPPDFERYGNIIQPTRKNLIEYAIIAGSFYTDGNTEVALASESVGFGGTFDSPSYYAAVGGIDERTAQIEIDFSYNEFCDRYNRNIKFLNYLPRVKITNLLAKEYVYFYYQKDQTETHITLRYLFTLENGTQITVNNAISTILATNVANGGAIYKAEISRFDFANFETINGSIQRYEVSVIAHNGAAITNPTVVVAPQIYELRRDIDCTYTYADLVWLNPLGGFDSIFCYGAREWKIKSNQKTNDRFIDYGLQWAERAKEATYYVEGRIGHALNVGTLNQEMLTYVTSILNSTDVFLSIEGRRFSKVKLVGSDHAFDSDMLNKPLILQVEHLSDYYYNDYEAPNIPPGAGNLPVLFPNESQTAVCGVGLIGAPVTIPAGTYFSAVSINDANAQALAAATSLLVCVSPPMPTASLCYTTLLFPFVTAAVIVPISGPIVPQPVASSGQTVSFVIPIGGMIVNAGSNGHGGGNVPIYLNGVFVGNSFNGGPLPANFTINNGDVVSFGSPTC